MPTAGIYIYIKKISCERKEISWKGTKNGCRVTSGRVIIISPTSKLCVDRKFIAIITVYWTATSRLLRDPPWSETQQLEMTVNIMELLYVATDDSCSWSWLIVMWFVLAILTQYLVLLFNFTSCEVQTCDVPPSHFMLYTSCCTRGNC